MLSFSARPAGARKPLYLLACAALLASGGVAMAHSFSSGSLKIGHPWSRETAEGQSAGGGFMTITNSGQSEDRLTGGTAEIARQVQVHSMTMDGGVMRMRQLKDGLAIPAGGTVALKPGSFHVMFIGLKRPLQRGELVPVTLHFAKAGKVAVQFRVEAVTYGGTSHDQH